MTTQTAEVQAPSIRTNPIGNVGSGAVSAGTHARDVQCASTGVTDSGAAGTITGLVPDHSVGQASQRPNLGMLTRVNPLPRLVPAGIIAGTAALSTIITAAVQWAGNQPFKPVPALVAGIAAGVVLAFGIQALRQGRRAAVDSVATIALGAAFAIAVVPLVSVFATVVTRGAARFDTEFFTHSMRGMTGVGGGALHALLGSALITGAAAIMAVPIGIFTAIYLVEFGTGRAARTVTFLVDVMTGIPSIVAGLFAYTAFAYVLGPGTRIGLIGAVALAVLMLPVVIRAAEEMLRLVPTDLREASLALGVPKWKTTLGVVLPTAAGGLATSVMLAVARVIGETAPLLIAAGFTASMNYNLFAGRMQSLPVYIYTQFANQGAPSHAFLDRAWTGALVLILLVTALNLTARLVARRFQPSR